MNDNAQTKLIEIAARITDSRIGAISGNDWLQEFRKVYRHMAATAGERFSTQTTMSDILAATEKDLTKKTN